MNKNKFLKAILEEIRLARKERQLMLKILRVNSIKSNVALKDLEDIKDKKCQV